MIGAFVLQFFQFLLVLLLAPGLTGLVRKVKARLLGRRGPSLLQPYRDLLRLLRKDAVIAQNASWLFRFAPLSDLHRPLARRRADPDLRPAPAALARSPT